MNFLIELKSQFFIACIHPNNNLEKDPAKAIQDACHDNPFLTIALLGNKDALLDDPAQFDKGK